MNCPFCLKTIEVSGAAPAFCPWCGKALSASPEDGFAAELASAVAQEDPVKQHELLMDLKRRYPDQPEVERRLLYLGRMYERGGKPDFYRIPFWPLCALDKNAPVFPREREKMLASFFGNPEVERVAALFDDREAFLDEYYRYMCASFVDMFLKHANRNMMFLSFRRSERDVCARCAKQMQDILRAAEQSPLVPEAQRARLISSLRLGFEDVFGVSLP